MEGPEVHSHHHGGHSGHRWFDITASLCAMVVSVASLYLAIHHGQVMQEMAQANARLVTAASWPSISYSTSNVDENGRLNLIRMSLTNKGVGPARIEGMEVSYDGQPVTSLRALLQACCAGGDALGRLRWVQSAANGKVMRPGEEKHFAHIERGDDEAVWERLSALPAKVSVKVCYCSVFDDCWVTRNGSRKPEPVAACPADWTQYGS